SILHYRCYRTDQITTDISLTQTAVSACLLHLVDQFIAIINRQHNYLRVWQILDDLSCGVESICPWHTEIQDCDVRPELLGSFYCLLAVARLRYHCPVGIIRENGPNAYPKDFVTTCYEQANAWHFIFLSAAGGKTLIGTNYP